MSDINISLDSFDFDIVTNSVKKIKDCSPLKAGDSFFVITFYLKIGAGRKSKKLFNESVYGKMA